ncbi:LON peptidase substrate-binding domain-containing protein, partial [Alphaproteobacteria bacterium]|nr:LON peptidase substrate-binding domain-containing protein [Alphaproteobacteria bacterium]
MNLNSIPVLPLRDIVVFPHMVAPLFVGRKPSVNALNNVMTKDKKILLITQTNPEVDSPNSDHLYKVGTLAKVLQLLKLPDGTIKVLVEGLERVNIKEFASKNDFLVANYSLIKTKSKNNSNIRAFVKIILEQFESYQKINKKISPEILSNLKTYNDYNKLADVVIANLNINLIQKQELLETISLEKSLDKIYGYLIAEIDSMQIEKKIKGRVKRQMEKTQKEYYLNEQMKAIQKELGDNDEVDDIVEIENKLKKLKLSSEASEKCKSEIKKLKNMSP